MTSATRIRPITFSQVAAWLKQLFESALNWFFSLTHSAARNRDAIRWVFFLSLWGYAIATLYDLSGWQQVITPFIAALSSLDMSAIIIQAGILLFSSIFHPLVLRHLLVLLAPFMLVHRFAAIYLADIFEKDVEVATRFINQAAFGEDYLTIHVREGKLVESDEGSPVVQIGGPGYITVELDSAVVFERPDGTLHIIGPTGDKPHGREVIDDFERLRQCIDLRDIIDRQDISNRSRDGIPVSARDIQYSYSIYRGASAAKTLSKPYPFDEQAIATMVYGGSRPAVLGKVPDKAPEWKKTLPGKLFVNVGAEFGGFISRRGLSEFFSSIGSPEEESLRLRQDTVLKDGQDLAGQNGLKPGESPLKAGPFTARLSLSDTIFGAKFRDFITKNKGLQVNWIGVGTWETPSEIIPANHLNAWKTSQENRKLSSADNIRILQDGVRSNTLINLINELPLLPYVKTISQIEMHTKPESEIENEAIELLFEGYRKSLTSVAKHYEDHQQPVPAPIATALESINRLLYHFVGNDYYVCLKTSVKNDPNIQGARIYAFDVAFSVQPMPGYKHQSVQFDFGNSPQLEFIFDLDAPNASVQPSSRLPEVTMKADDLYISAHFDVSLLPFTTSEVTLNVHQARRNLASMIEIISA